MSSVRSQYNKKGLIGKIIVTSSSTPKPIDIINYDNLQTNFLKKSRHLQKQHYWINPSQSFGYDNKLNNSTADLNPTKTVNCIYAIDLKFQMTLLSSPVFSAYWRCWDKTGATWTIANIEAKSSEVGSLCSIAACRTVCKICRGSPWLTTKIAHLQDMKQTKITLMDKIYQKHTYRNKNNLDVG